MRKVIADLAVTLDGFIGMDFPKPSKISSYFPTTTKLNFCKFDI